MIGARRGMLRSALTLSGALQRFAFALFAGLAIGLMALDRFENPTIVQVRTQAVDLLAPALDVMSHPLSAIDDAVARVGRFIDVYEENARLREEVDRLLHWQAVARSLDADNREYRALLSTVAEPRSAFVTARIIGMSGGSFVRTALVAAGSRDGVAVGQAVVAAGGLLGRIVEVGNNSARILLLNDLNSRVPVFVEASRAPAVLAGDNTDTLQLAFVADGAEIAVGDRLVTSGEGGLIPPGLPVGVVTGRSDGIWRVQSFVTPARVEYVRILDYALPGLLPATREAGAAGQLW